MIRFLFSSFILLLFKPACQAQFAPAAGHAGSTAIYKDSTIFSAWATACQLNRGYQNIADKSLGKASVGDSSLALGKAGENGVVSLGDGGSAILSFKNPIKNGPGYDFAIFENTFVDSFLELAFVEVSSDGINYVRFPATSNTQDTLQTGGFGYTQPTSLNNLAGKYRAMYGTPFDLQELSNIPNLNINAITHVKIIDVVGSIQNQWSSMDQFNHKINDPWPTPFASCGFDLDAVGVIHSRSSNLIKIELVNLVVYPNPANQYISVQSLDKNNDWLKIELVDLSGKNVYDFSTQNNPISSEIKLELGSFNSGYYILKIQTNQGVINYKISIQHD